MSPSTYQAGVKEFIIDAQAGGLADIYYIQGRRRRRATPGWLSNCRRGMALSAIPAHLS
jgi:hypothetical protein